MVDRRGDQAAVHLGRIADLVRAKQDEHAANVDELAAGIEAERRQREGVDDGAGSGGQR